MICFKSVSNTKLFDIFIVNINHGEIFLKTIQDRPFRKHYTIQDRSTLSNRQRTLHYIHEVPLICKSKQAIK